MYYRAYVLDQNGRIRAAHELHAPSDAEALGAAVNLEHAYGLELWEHARRVAIVPPDAPPPPQPQGRRLD